MRNKLLALTAITLASTLPLEARRIMCEDCEPQPIECDEHLFVERSQLFITGEFLYWTVDEGVLDYAIKKDKATSLPANTDGFGIGKYQTVDYEWRPGFRVALAWYRCPRYWEVKGEYTWLYNKGSASVSNEDLSENFINPTSQTITEGPFSRSNATIDLHYHVGDVNVARVFDPNPHLRMRVVGGLTIAYVKQEMDQLHANFVGNSDQIEDKWRYFGGGIRLGVSADWFWGCQFYLTGKTTFATLIGTYKNEAIQYFDETQLARCTEYDDHRFTMNAQFLLGPSWQKPCDCWSIEIFAGYEFNIWLNLQERYRQEQTDVDETKETRLSRGLFGLHGLTARLTLGF